MLSNKLTFSLASLIMILALVLASTSAMAVKPTVTIKEVGFGTVTDATGTTPLILDMSGGRVGLVISVTSSHAHTYNEWNALMPSLNYVDALGRKLDDDTDATNVIMPIVFTPATPTDPFGLNAGFTANSPLRMKTVYFATSLTIPTTSDDKSMAAHAVMVMVKAGALRVGTDGNDMADATFDLPPALGSTVTVELKGANTMPSVGQPYMLTLVFSNVDAAATEPPTLSIMPTMYDVMIDPPADRVGMPTIVTSAAGATTTTYMMRILPMTGATSMTIKIDPAYAMYTPGTTDLKVTDSATDAVLGAKAFHVYTGSGTQWNRN